jgi:hypothetical protein
MIALEHRAAALRSPSMRTLALPDLLRGLILQRGWSFTAAGRAAGISPLAVDRWCAQPTAAATTWLRLIAGFRAQVLVVRGAETWAIQIPTPASQVRERGRRTWRHRRFLHYLHAIAAQNPRLKRNERELRARGYVANEETRIASGIEEARRRMTTVLLAGEVAGMRCAVQALVRASHLTPDELSFSSGVGTDATTKTLDATDDGRLMPLRRLLAALDARLELHLPSGARVVIASSDAAPVVHDHHDPRRPERHPRARSHGRHDGSASRSRLDRDEVLRLYDAGIPITRIGEQAGISRQRVHAVAKAAGRMLRRLTMAESRSRRAAEILA